MSLQSVRNFFAENAPDIEVLVLDQSTATVAEAAQGHGVPPEQIAKTLSLRVGDRVILVATSGTARLDNKKAKAAFGGKVKMLDFAEVEDLTGHPVGGVCLFGVKPGLELYCDMSIKAYAEVVPAAGAPNSAVRIAPDRMAALTGAAWIDVCN